MTETLAVREVALAEARTLARHGRYTEAEELLDEAWRDAEPSAAYLDLLARIHAQQGHLERADECWERAQRLAPGEPAYAAGRRRIARLRSGSRKPGRVTGAVVCAVVLLSGGVVAGLVSGAGPEGRSAPVTTHPAQPPTPTASPDVLAALRPDVPGTRVRRDRDELTVSFTHDLFRKDAAFSPSGRAVLGRIGSRLRPYADRIVITVIGYTDSRPMTRRGPYASNLELGEARAGAVREVLRHAAGMPTSRISVSSLGGVMSPRARTAVLRISVAPGGGS